MYCFVNQGALLNAYESQSMASSSGSNPSCVLMIYGMDAARFNCQRVFNLLCVYGNIIKVSFSEEHLSRLGLCEVRACKAHSVSRLDV